MKRDSVERFDLMWIGIGFLLTMMCIIKHDLGKLSNISLFFTILGFIYFTIYLFLRVLYIEVDKK